MNKYQEALDLLKNLNLPYKILQELIELRNPKRLHYEGDGFADGLPVLDIAYCPNCGRRFEVDYDEKFKNCPDCTQALDWTMEVLEENEENVKNIK